MSKMNKIKNYNQVLLAIAGTIGIIFLCVMVFFAVQDLSKTFYRSSNTNNGILATDQTAELLKDSLRKQVISFNRIEVLDSISQTFLLPVTQANLAKGEYTSSFGFMKSGPLYNSFERYAKNIYNNLILYNTESQSSELVFKDRISIDDYILYESNSKKYIIIPACSRDSNKDGFLNEQDLQELFVYDIQNKKLSKIEAEENYTTLRAFQPKESRSFIVHFGIDRNKNGVFERSKEPMIFYRINLETMTLEPFISNDKINNLQELLDGR